MAEQVTMVVWKFPLPFPGLNVLEMPEGAEVLTVQMQGDYPVLWALCNPDAPKQTRTFLQVMTGHWLTHRPGRYVATVQVGDLVVHVFEEAV